jgi:hypothetical protein
MCSFCTGAYVSRIDVFSNVCRPTWDFGWKKIWVKYIRYIYIKEFTYICTCSTSVTQSKASDFYTTEKVALNGQLFPFI